MRKTIAALAVTAGLAGGAIVGAPMLSSAAPGDPPAPPAPPGPSAPAAPAERDGWAKRAIDGLVAKGTINREQGDAVLDALREARPKHPRAARLMIRRHAIEVSAEAIGIPVAELRAQVRSGHSVAEVAATKGVPEQKVVDAIVAEATKALAKAVEAGRLTQAKADELLAQLPERAKAFVEAKHPGDDLRP